jgi:hypothetical protein
MCGHKKKSQGVRSHDLGGQLFGVLRLIILLFTSNHLTCYSISIFCGSFIFDANKRFLRLFGFSIVDNFPLCESLKASNVRQ